MHQNGISMRATLELWQAGLIEVVRDHRSAEDVRRVQKQLTVVASLLADFPHDDGNLRELPPVQP
jgi:hypothetical protein